MTDNVVKLPNTGELVDGYKEVEIPKKGKGITNISKLRKKVSEIDINNIFSKTDKVGFRNIYWFNKQDNTYVLDTSYFNKVFSKKDDEFIYKVGIQKVSKRYDRYWYSYPEVIQKLRDKDRTIEVAVAKFTGGKGNGAYMHEKFSDCIVFYDKNRGDILYIRYADDVDIDDETGKDVKSKFFKHFLRSNIESNIPNNWKDLFTIKDYEFIISTTTYEKITSKGLNEKDARNNAIKKDPSLEWKSGYYNGMREFVRNPENINLETKEEIENSAKEKEKNNS